KKPQTTPQSSILLLLLTTPLLALAVPAPLRDVGKPSGVDITVYSMPDCKGTSHKRPNMKYGDNAQDTPAARSYRLSKDLADDDYLTFGQRRPFVAHGKDAEKGCHNLKFGSYFFTFYKTG
ncbi:MAG: hypothetical protein Q9206_006407, partial [Seirophora lacunosa]